MSNGATIPNELQQCEPLTMVPKGRSSCSSNVNTAQPGARPPCQAFPYAQANPADIVADEDAVIDMSEFLQDDDIDMRQYPRSNSDGSSSAKSAIWSTETTASSTSSLSTDRNKRVPSRQSTLSYEDGLTYLDSLDLLMNSGNTPDLGAVTDQHELLDNINASHTGPTDNAPVNERSSRTEVARHKLQEKVNTMLFTMSVCHHSGSTSDPDEGAAALQDLRLNNDRTSRGIRLLHAPLTIRPLGCTKLLKRRQLELWRNYIENIAPWLDVCGSKRHFQHNIPLLAKNADHLHYAILALSARHLELKASSAVDSESSGLYQDTVNLILSELDTMDTGVLAACVLLCVYETLDGAPTTLSAPSVAKLMQAARLNAKATGIQQALFWSFANLTVCNDSSVTLSPKAFCLSGSLHASVNYIRSLTLGEGYAKYAIFLSSIVNQSFPNTSETRGSNNSSTAKARWLTLHDLLEDWHNCRVEEMVPLMSYPSILDDHHHPFPMVLYGCNSACLGNLLYHTASITLLDNRPNTIELPKSNKSMIWHARQICGIVSEHHDAAVRVNAMRPLSTAGKVVRSQEEKKAVLTLFKDIERQTGWDTSSKVEELEMYWRG